MLPPSAALKLSRADQHINDLNRLIGAFLDENPFKLVRRFNPETGDLTLSIKGDKPVPDEIALTLGDALHNLRAVLDHTYFAIISPHTDRRDNIQFPIYRRDNKKDVLGRRLIKLTTKEVGAAIEACEPEPGGCYEIHDLDAVDVEDKHRILLVAARCADLRADLINFIMPEGAIQIIGPGVLRFAGQGDDLIRIPLDPTHPTAKRGAFEDDVKLSTNFSLMFGEGTPFQSREVIPKVVALRKNIEEAASKVWSAANP